MYRDTICDVPGIKVGHAQDFDAKTGCTVIIPSNGAIAGVDVRGSATGTREIELLYPTRLISKIHAIILSGGSAFGLDAAGGVQQFLEEQNIGYDTGVAKVPIVPAAVIYDLAVGSHLVRPDKKMGYIAAKNAVTSETSQGCIGAGTGATVGKLAGQLYCMNGGIGTCSTILMENIILGVLFVVNAIGNIIDPDLNITLAGALNPNDGSFYDPLKILKDNFFQPFTQTTNTTLGIVATNATLTKEEAIKVAQMANDGLARTIKPAHTQFDGDIIFCISTESEKKISPLILGTFAAELTAKAIINAVKSTNNLKWL